jgi:hypothetical protein
MAEGTVRLGKRLGGCFCSGGVDFACIYVRSRVDISNTTMYGFCEKTALNFSIMPNHSLVFKL